MSGAAPEQALDAHDLLRTVFPRPLAEIEARLADQGEWAGDLLNTRRDKHAADILVSLTISPILNADGQIVGASKTRSGSEVPDRRRA